MEKHMNITVDTQVEFKKFPSLENTYRHKEVDMVETLGYHKEDYIVTEKVHGCFTHNTKLTLPDGTYKTIGSIVDEKYDGFVLGVNSIGEIVPTKVVNWWDNGEGCEWLKVTMQTFGGKGGRTRTLTVTPNHKFYYKGGYTPIGELDIGSEIECTYNGLAPSELQKQVMIGKMLGDGSLSNKSVAFSHTKSKEEYLHFTMKCLGSIRGNQQKDLESGFGSTVTRARTISSEGIDDIFSDWDKPKGVIPKIKLTPISLLFWYLDDGSICINEKQKPRISLATCAYTKISCLNLIESLGEIGINAKLQDTDGVFRISVSSESSELFFCMISPLVPECMQYKIPEHFRTIGGGIGMVNSSQHDAVQRKSKAVITKIEKLTVTQGRYDIETETHNYFANNIHVHNCNFSFWLSELEGEVVIRCAKRSGWIEDDEKFFNYKPVLEKYRESLERLYYFLNNTQGYGQVVVYGELFGGNIQSGMCYKEDQDFIAFDLHLDGVPVRKSSMILDLKVYAIPTTPIIGIYPTLKEALDVQESFTSLLIRDDFDGAEEHKEAEGLVIEPVNPRWYPNGSRIYFKKKTKRFLEKGGNKIQKPKEELPSELEGILLQSFEYITKPRFEAVVSKIGEVNIKDIGKVMGLMTKDILEDMAKDEIETPENKKFMKLLQTQVQTFIRPILLEM